jgi:tetratricopeptide (TPR) repeat protein
MKRLAVIVLVLSTAHADEDARSLRTRGLRAYDVQRYDEAIDAFRHAYEIDPQPDLLYALAQAERMSGDCRRAVDAYRAFLRSNPPSQQAASARKNLGRCEMQLAAAPPPPQPSPAPTAVILVEPAVPPPAPPRRAARDTAGHVMMALGVAGLVSGAALWGVAQGDIDAVNRSTSYDQFVNARAAAAHAEGERIGGIVTVAVGGALVLAAAIHYGVWARGR